MNKIIFAGLVLATLVLSSCSTSTYRDKYMTLGSMGLKGNVKTITDMYYVASYMDGESKEHWQKGSLVEGESNTHQRRYFDKQGKHLKQDFLTHTKEVRATYLSVWNEVGTTVLYDKYLRDGETLYIGEHSYPSKDSVIVNTHGGNDNIITQQFHSKIDSKGREVSCKYYTLSEEGEIIGTTDISSKYKGDREIEFLFKSNVSRSHHFLYTYLEFDEHGNWTKAIREDKDQSNDYIIEREIEYYN